MPAHPVTLTHLSAALSKNEWKALLALAKSHRAALGFLPDSAFADRVRRGTLAVAHAGGQLVGYCLYDRSRRGQIKLVHVCVADTARRLGVGKQLVESVMQHNPGASGIVAHCRRDYTGIDRFWEALGMAPRAERAGRAVQGSTLSIWWRALGAPDLLEDAALTGGLPLVVYDTNVVSDLYASPHVDRPDRGASLGLLAGWLQTAITPAVSSHVDIELNRIQDEAERVRQMNLSQELLRLRWSGAENGATLERLRVSAGAAALKADPSLTDDLCHLADALTAGASFFVTNDENFLRVATSALGSDSMLQVIRPHELVIRMLDQLNGPSYRPRLLATPALEWLPATDVPEGLLVDAFISHECGESGASLTRSLRACFAQNPSRTRVLVDGTNRPWALLSDRVDGPQLTANIFRVRRGDAAGTTALQLARHLRERALESGVTQTTVSDPSLNMVSVEALRKDGFDVGGAAPVATLIASARTREDVESSFPSTAGLPAADLERRFWPLTLLSEGIPTFVAPIRPRYAKRLFGLQDDALWSDRKRGLGLSREHAYFSAANRALPPEGSRILWYATADDTDVLRRMVAHSRSRGAQRLSPEQAHDASSHLGVYRRRDVDAAAGKDGLVTVLRFEDTAILPTPLGAAALDTVLERHSVKPPFLSFRQVPPAMFDDIVAWDGHLA